MSPDLERLIELQRLDTIIADARARVAAHPARLAEVDGRLAAARQTVDAIKDRIKQNQEERRTLEKDAAVYQGRLSKYKDQLAAVKTNREYQAMQHEIAAAQQELGGAEEKVIEHMVASDSLGTELKAAEAALAAQQKDVDLQKKALAAELIEVEGALGKALDARKAIVGALDAPLVTRFEQVGKLRKGVAICEATRDGLCSVCHVRLRPPVFQQVRANTGVVQCESCHRILYFVPPPPVVHNP
jgi:predicted  nucleic acid-binding Zn-ribbon protein